MSRGQYYFSGPFVIANHTMASYLVRALIGEYILPHLLSRLFASSHGPLTEEFFFHLTIIIASCI